MSQSCASIQSQLGMMVHGRWQVAGSGHIKQCERPDVLAKVPGAQQLQVEKPWFGLDVPRGHAEHADAPDTLL